MNNKEIRSEFKKLIILALHPECENYEGAKQREWVRDVNIDTNVMHAGQYYEGTPITIGRVMAALKKKRFGADMFYLTDIGEVWLGAIIVGKADKKIVNWQLTKDGIELTDDSQTIECITAIYNLLK